MVQNSLTLPCHTLSHPICHTPSRFRRDIFFAQTEHVKEGVDEQIAVDVAGVTLQNVDVVARYVRVLDVVGADLTT